MSFSIDQWGPTWIFIRDDNFGKSITNDAENVCEALVIQYGNRRIMYRDTDGTWDELVHDHGIFKRFELHGYTDYDVDKLKGLEAITL